MSFSKKQIEMLEAPLENQMVKEVQGNAYLPSTYVVDTANRVFGFDGWSSEVLELRILSENLNAKMKNGVGVEVVVLAHVKVTVKVGDNEYVSHTDVSTGSSKMGLNSISKVYDTAHKGAVSTAMTRCFRKFGNQFGNVLYQIKSGFYNSEQGSVYDNEEIESMPSEESQEQPKDDLFNPKKIAKEISSIHKNSLNEEQKPTNKTKKILELIGEAKKGKKDDQGKPIISIEFLPKNDLLKLLEMVQNVKA